MEYGKDEEAHDGFRNGKEGRTRSRREDDAGRTVGTDAEARQTALAAGEVKKEGSKD
jgi:hypothetical protein